MLAGKDFFSNLLCAKDHSFVKTIGICLYFSSALCFFLSTFSALKDLLGALTLPLNAVQF